MSFMARVDAVGLSPPFRSVINQELQDALVEIVRGLDSSDTDSQLKELADMAELVKDILLLPYSLINGHWLELLPFDESSDLWQKKLFISGWKMTTPG